MQKIRGTTTLKEQYFYPKVNVDKKKLSRELIPTAHTTSIIGLNFVTIVKLSNHLQSSFGIVIPPNAAERRKLMKTNELCILNSLLNVEILQRKYFYHLKSFFIYNI